MINTRPLLAIAGILVLTACGSTDQGEHQTFPEHVRQQTSALRPLASCNDLQDSMRSSLLRSMNQRIDKAMEAAIESGSVGCDYGAISDAGASPGDNGSAGSGGASGGGGGEEASEASSTNNQVHGVDEPDFIKNDKKYIYMVSGKSLHIVDAFPPSSAHEVSKVAIEGKPRSLLVNGNRLLVYSSVNMPVSDYNRSNGCSYGYDCDLVGDGSSTHVAIYDISDKSAPKLERAMNLSGSFISARMIGNSVHTVLYDPGTGVNLSYQPEELMDCEEHSPVEIRHAYEQLRRENTSRIMKADLGAVRPRVDTIDYVNGKPHEQDNLLGQCQGFYASSIADGSGFLTVASIDIDNDTSFANSTIYSRPGALYASGESLYVSIRHQRQDNYGWYESMQGQNEASAVHKFSLGSSPASSAYQASGLIEGRVLNQFSMDEYDGSLRIATTTGHLPDPKTHNQVLIMKQSGARLSQVGAVQNIAPGEDIRSVRFDRNRGYVVTFKKTDPLFVLDLTSATAPKILGELKIPGYSTYMHMMDDKHLLTIGFDAQDEGNFAWFQGVMLQIFDVTNPVAPKLLHKEVIGTRGSNSEATSNHLAFNFFPPKNALAFPMTVCEDSAGGGSYGTKMSFTGLMVFDTTVQNGFHLQGRIPFADPTSAANQQSACNTWWTNPHTVVRRSVFMDNFVYAVTADQIKVDSLDSLGTDIADITLTD